MTTNCDKLREALIQAKEKLLLYRAAHSGEYIGGTEFKALMHLIDEALAASKPEPQTYKPLTTQHTEQSDLIERVLSIAGFYEPTWVGDRGDLERLISAALLAEDCLPEQTPIPADIAKVLHDNLWDTYVTDESKPEQQAQAGEPELVKWTDAPQTIYLQVCAEDDGECSTPFHDHIGVTWCEDKINDSDIKYVRAEALAKRDAALDACAEALKYAQFYSNKQHVIEKMNAAITKAQEARKS